MIMVGYVVYGYTRPHLPFFFPSTFIFSLVLCYRLEGGARGERERNGKGENLSEIVIPNELLFEFCFCFLNSFREKK